MDAAGPQAAAHDEARSTPEERASVMNGLPFRYTPRVAGYARGPFITPDSAGIAPVAPSDWRWRHARTVVVRDADGIEWRCLRVSSPLGFVGYWAVEQLGVPLPITEGS